MESLRPGPRRRPTERSDHVRDRRHPRGQRHGSRLGSRRRRRCAATPARRANDPVTSPTNVTGPTGAVTSFTGAQPANANSNGDPADQYVAKHFPMGWFTSLTGESAEQPESVNQPIPPGRGPLNKPTHGRVRRDGRADQRGGRHQLRREPRRKPRRPHLRAGARPDAPRGRGPGVQLDHAEQLQRRPRRVLPGQQPLGRVQR